MKKLYTGLLAFLLIHNINAQTTIASEGFENGYSFFSVFSGAGAFQSGTLAAPGTPAGASFAAQGTYGQVLAPPTTLQSPAINTTGFTNIQISMKVAAFGLTAGIGLDQLDRVWISISTNGGGFYQDILYVTGATTNNSNWAFTATGTATSAYPTSTVVNAPSSGINLNGPSTMTITNLPSQNNLLVRVSANAGFNERWIIDDFKVTGDLSLPITLLSFNVRLQNDHPVLKWEIATPVDGFLYEIQRSKDGNHFETVSDVMGDAITTQFGYTDPAGMEGNLFFRLRMTDIDGKITFSNILRLSAGKDQVALFYPNLVRSMATLRLNEIDTKGVTGRLLNMNGMLIKTILIKDNFQLIDLSGLSPGFYLLSLSNGKTFKFVKE